MVQLHIVNSESTALIIAISIIILLLLVAGFGVIIKLQLKKPNGQDEELTKLREENNNLKSLASEKEQKSGELKAQLNTVSSEKDELVGKNKQLNENINSLKVEQKITISENDNFKKQVNAYESQKENDEQQKNEKITQLDNAKIALEQERARVIKEDEEKREKELQELDRMWNEHENKVISLLKDLCKNPELNFTTYDNKNLPESWDGKHKPDFMIEFLNQYIIFDAKVSKQDNLQTYINNQVKSTSEKMKNNSNIFPLVFFVVPTQAIQELNKTYFYEQGVSFYAVSPEALAPILACLKKITTYELAEHFDPQQRENIINHLADLDYHINFRNAYDLLVAQMGVAILENRKKIDEDTQEQILQKKEKMRLALPGKSDIKKYMSSTKDQEEQINKLATPKAEVEKDEMNNVKLLISQNEG